MINHSDIIATCLKVGTGGAKQRHSRNAGSNAHVRKPRVNTDDGDSPFYKASAHTQRIVAYPVKYRQSVQQRNRLLPVTGSA